VAKADRVWPKTKKKQFELLITSERERGKYMKRQGYTYTAKEEARDQLVCHS